MKEIIQEALSKGVELHVAGEFDLASQLYASVIKLQPNHDDANHNMGVLKLTTGHDLEALPFLQTALQANTNCTEFWLSYIKALIKLEKLEDAARILDLAKENGIESEEFVELIQLINPPTESVPVSEPEADTPSQSKPNILNSLKLNQDFMIAEKMAAYQARVDAMRPLYIDFPAHVHFETLASCNASCSFCPYPQLERKGERMGDELVKKIISDLDDIPKHHKFQLSLFKVNEPFLDVRLFDILEEIKNKLPNATVTLTSNASPITEKKLERLSQFSELGYLWISFNDHRKAEYEKTMGLPYDRTISRLRMIHKKKSEGSFKPRVVLSRVSDGTKADHDFINWVKSNFPIFQTSIFPRGEWLGQINLSKSQANPPKVGCTRWFDLSITATGLVAHCCMDGKAEYPIGDAKKNHLLEIYNGAEFRRLREFTEKRNEASPCSKCSFL